MLRIPALQAWIDGRNMIVTTALLLLICSLFGILPPVPLEGIAVKLNSDIYYLTNLNSLVWVGIVPLLLYAYYLYRSMFRAGIFPLFKTWMLIIGLLLFIIVFLAKITFANTDALKHTSQLLTIDFVSYVIFSFAILFSLFIVSYLADDETKFFAITVFSFFTQLVYTGTSACLLGELFAWMYFTPTYAIHTTIMSIGYTVLFTVFITIVTSAFPLIFTISELLFQSKRKLIDTT